MNTDIENLLREGMERFTADLRAPAGLTRRVARRRRRRLALRSATGAAAALAAAAATLVAVLLPGGTGGAAAAAAYVVKRVDGALSAADPGEIAQVTVTFRGTGFAGGTSVTSIAEEWSYGDRWRFVANSPAGQPVYDEGSGAASLYTVVNYPQRTWGRQRLSVLPAAGYSAVTGPAGCAPVVAAASLLFQPGLPGAGFSFSSPPATVATALRAAVSCGTLTVAGRQRVDGIDAIKLSSRPGSLIAETVWVSPGTYLPVRMVIRPASGQPGPSKTADITWLPPTPRNLAKLTVPVPAGFRRVPVPEAVSPMLPLAPGQWPPNMMFCYARAACQGKPIAVGPGLGALLPLPLLYRGLPPRS
jgi:hypothetical protein